MSSDQIISYLKACAAALSILLILPGTAIAEPPLNITVSGRPLTFTPPETYCFMAQGNGIDGEFFQRMRRESEPNGVLISMFAYCHEYKQWLNGEIPHLLHFGAVLLRNWNGEVKPHNLSAPRYIKQIEQALASDDRAVKDSLFSALGNVKPRQADIIYGNAGGLIVGMIVDMKSPSGTPLTLAGGVALMSINGLPVDIHYYQPNEASDSVQLSAAQAFGTSYKMMEQDSSFSLDAIFDGRPKEVKEKTIEKIDTSIPHPDYPKLKSPENLARSEIISALKRHDFDSLKRTFETDQTAYEAGNYPEETLLNSYFAFGVIDPSLEEHFDAWIEAEPKHYLPKAARGIYRFHLGRLVRGDNYTNLTPSYRLNQMASYFRMAKEDLTQAAALHPKLGVAWGFLVLIADLSNQPPWEIYKAGIKLAPESFFLRRAIAESFDPLTAYDVYGPKWIRHEVLRVIAGFVYSSYLLREFYLSLEQETEVNAPLQRIWTRYTMDKTHEAFKSWNFSALQRGLVGGLRGDVTYRLSMLAGQFSMNREAYPRAIDEFNAGLAHNDLWHRTLMFRADALRNRGISDQHFPSHAMALRDLRVLVDINSHHPDILIKAAKELWEVASVFPKHAAEVAGIWDMPGCSPESLKPKRSLFTSLSDRDPDKIEIFCAIDDLLERALKYGDSEFDLHEMRGRLYLYGLLQPASALAEFERALSINPNHTLTWANYGRTLQELGRCDEVKPVYERYMQLCSRGACADNEMMGTRLHLGGFNQLGTCQQL